MTLTAWLMLAGGVLTAYAAGRWSVPAWALAACAYHRSVAANAASRARAARGEAVDAARVAERAAVKAARAADDTLPFTRREL